MTYKKLLAVMLFFLVLLPLVFADVVHNPQPTISVIYDELNAPITIQSAYLSDRFGNLFDLSEPVSNPGLWQFNFTVLDYLPNQDYFFEIDAEDNNSNPRSDKQNITIDVDYMPINVVKPLSPLFMGKDTQDFAIGTGLPFNMTVHSAAPTICRLKPNSINPISPEREWNRSVRQFNDGSSTPKNLHTMPMVKDDGGSFFLFEPSELNYKNLFLNTFLVVCEQDQDPKSIYHQKIIYLGYDTSAPEYDITFSPSLIEDPSNVSTVMNITTTGDKVACKYQLTQNGNVVESGQFPSVVTSFNDLFSTFEHTFDYSSIKTTFAHNQPYEFVMTTNCTNPAGLWSEKQRTFTIQRSSELRIGLEKKYFSTSTPTITLTTNMEATCFFSEDGVDTPFTSSADGKTHTYTGKTFEEGINSLPVVCQAIEGTTEKSNLRIIIDTVKPLAPVVGSSDYNCERRLSVKINRPEPTDEVRYNISLYNSSTTNEASMILAPELTPYTDDDLLFRTPSSVNTRLNKSYTWLIIPIDKAGNIGPSTKHTTTRVSSDDIACDGTNPIPSLDIQKKEASYEITINCRDAESGCTDSFRSTKIALNQTCNYSQGTLTSYTANPLVIATDKRLCFTVIDRAGNEKSGKVDVKLDLDQQIAATCTNGYRDLDEEGVDCGGICGSDKPCPEQEIDEFVLGEEDAYDEEVNGSVCMDDFDCPYGEICVEGICIYEPETSGGSLLGLILLILGLLFIAGGIGYIAYSEKQKKAYAKQKYLHDQQLNRNSAEVAAKRLADEKKYLEELKKKRELGNAKKEKLSKEKKAERSKLLEEFDKVNDTEKESEEDPESNTEESTEPKEIFNPEELHKESELKEPEEETKLDEGLEGDFVDVEKLGKKEDKVSDEKTSKKDIFEDLKELNEKQKKKKNETESSN